METTQALQGYAARPDPTISYFERLDPPVGSRMATFGIDFGSGVVVRGFSVVRRRDGSRFIGMPSWKVEGGGYRDVIVIPDELYWSIAEMAMAELDRLVSE